MLADKLGRFNVMIFITLLSTIVTLAIWIPAAKSTAGIVVFVVIFGFSSGGFVSLFPTLVAQISDIRQIGVRTGLVMGVTSFGALTGSPIGGAIAGADHGSYLGLQLYCGVCMGASVIFYILARGKLVGFSQITAKA